MYYICKKYICITYWQKSLGHVNVWQKPLQYCKVISLQLIKINEKKNQTNQPNKQKTCLLFQIFSQCFFLLLLRHLWQRLLVSSMSLSFYFFLSLHCVQCSTLPSPQEHLVVQLKSVFLNFTNMYLWPTSPFHFQLHSK